jgi:hypothetical protein
MSEFTYYPSHPLLEQRLSGPVICGPLDIGKRGAVVAKYDAAGAVNESVLRTALLFVD